MIDQKPLVDALARMTVLLRRLRAEHHTLIGRGLIHPVPAEECMFFPCREINQVIRAATLIAQPTDNSRRASVILLRCADCGQPLSNHDGDRCARERAEQLCYYINKEAE